MQQVFLVIGFMAAGKTTAASAAAAKLGLSFYDLDQLIEAEANNSISEIFAGHGEAGFRKIEHQSFSQLMQRVDGVAVIAAGGGLPVYKDNQKLISECQVVFLDTPWTEIETRIETVRLQRPLLHGKPIDEIRKLWVARREIYFKLADFVIKQGSQLTELISKIMTGATKINE